MNFLKAIIHPSYWWTHQHPVPEEWKLGLTIFFGLLLVSGVMSALLSSRKKFRTPVRRFFSRFSAWGFVMGFLGYILLFFSLQRAAYLSARGFYLLWLIVATWWLVVLIRYAVKDIPRILEKQKEKEAREKYLPKRKK